MFITFYADHLRMRGNVSLACLSSHKLKWKCSKSSQLILTADNVQQESSSRGGMFCGAVSSLLGMTTLT